MKTVFFKGGLEMHAGTSRSLPAINKDSLLMNLLILFFLVIRHGREFIRSILVHGVQPENRNGK